jgi:TolA-binding protein
MSGWWDDIDAEERGLLEVLGVRIADLPAAGSACPPPELMLVISEVELPEPLRTRLERHVEECPLCQVLKRDLSELGPEALSPSAVHRIRGKLPRTPRRAAGTQASWISVSLWRPLVATVALAAFAIIVYKQAVRVTPQTQIVHREVAPTQPAKPEENFITLEKPGVKLTASALLLRSEEGDSQKFLKDLAPALDAYRKDDYASAAERFVALTKKHPRSVEVYFYLGVSRLYTKDYSGAVTALETARKLADDTFSDDIAWYLMLAHQRTGEKEKAEAERKKICSGSGLFAQRACEIAIK